MLATSTELHQDHLLRLRAELATYSAANLLIRTKPPDSRLEPFELNTAQRLVDAKAERQKIETGRIRTLVLKGRQLGISTYVGVRIYHGCTLWAHRRGMVLADQLERAGEIFGIYERFDQYAAARPPKRTSRRARELSWTTDSKLTVETARDKDTGRGSTLDYVHASEFASWPYPADTLAGLLDAVPADAGEIWIESTAKGVGNEFHAMWEAATAGESEWLPIFLPWWIGDDYHLDVDDETRAHVLATLDPWETEALERGIAWEEPNPDLPAVLPSGARFEKKTGRWRLSVQQIAWRRRKLRQGDELTFRQENPSTATEAFLVSGSPFFSQEALAQFFGRTRKPLHRGNFIERGGALFLEKADRGYVRVFEEPDPDGHYVLGGDTAEGKSAAAQATSLSDPEGERGGRDFCSADVLKVSELVATGGKKVRIPVLRQVAQIHGRMAPEVFAAQVYGAACWWSCPGRPDAPKVRRPHLIGIERNHDSGQTTIRQLLERWRHANMFIHRRMNTRQAKPTVEYGFVTDGTTRMPMLDELAALVRDGQIEIASAETLREMTTFVRNLAGRPEAQEGCHDDRVMGLGIAVQMRLHHSCGLGTPPMPPLEVEDTPTGI